MPRNSRGRSGDTPRDESGRFGDEYPPEQFVEALESGDLQTPATTREVAESVGCNHDTAYKKLKSLSEAGRVSERKAGQTLLWSPLDG